METREKHSLQLDELLLETAQKELNTFAEMYPDDFDEINCDVKWLVVELVKLLLKYLLVRCCKAAHATTARITNLNRQTVYNYEKSSAF